MKREDEQGYLEEAIRQDNEAYKRMEAEYERLLSASIDQGLVTNKDVTKLDAEEAEVLRTLQRL